METRSSEDPARLRHGQQDSAAEDFQAPRFNAEGFYADLIRTMAGQKQALDDIRMKSELVLACSPHAWASSRNSTNAWREGLQLSR
mmetsp:Transcript_45463/g.105432  ORF Transcript_45463/g.105432 Transcript_45463/m.105432 type:complete len:86 (-) Transcript_45463:41-298(-)